MDFKNEVLKILNKLIKTIDENAGYYKKEVEAIRRCQEKSENSFPETKPELKAMNRRRNAEERISDLENRITEITQSKQQTGSQTGGGGRNESNIKEV